MNRQRRGLWTIRLRQAGLLAPMVARTIRLLPILVTGGFAYLLTFVAHNGHHGGVLHVQIGAIFLSLGAGFVLDDTAEATVASVPAPRLFRRSFRVGLILPLLAVIWASLLWYAGTDGFGWALTTQLVGILGLSVATAAVASHIVPDGLGGIATGPTILLLFVGQNVLPPRFHVLPLSPVSPSWFDVYGRWWLALAFGALVFVLASLDPARRRLRLSPRRDGARPQPGGLREAGAHSKTATDRVAAK